MILISRIFPTSVAALLTDAVPAHEVPPNCALVVDDASGEMDVIMLASASDALEAALGSVGAFIAPLLDYPDARRTLIIAGHLAPARDGGVEIEDKSGRETRRVMWNAVASALLTAQELGVGVAQCPDAADAVAEMMMMIARRDRRPVVARRAVDPRSGAISWIASIPGVGEETARALLDYARTPGHALCALTDGAAPPPALPRDAWKRVVERARLWLGLDDRVKLFVTGVEDDEPEHQ